MNKASGFYYKGYIGSIEYSADDECFFGKVLEVGDIISYKGKELTDLRIDFECAVDTYIREKEVDDFKAFLKRRISILNDAIDYNSQTDSEFNRGVIAAHREEIYMLKLQLSRLEEKEEDGNDS